MEDNNFNENGFIIDLSDSADTAEIITRLGNILELPEAHNKQICLKMGCVDLSKSQLLSVKALISSLQSELVKVNSSSALTIASAQNLGIDTAELENKIEVEAPIEEEVQEEAVEEVSEVVEDTVIEEVSEEPEIETPEIEEPEEQEFEEVPQEVVEETVEEVEEPSSEEAEEVIDEVEEDEEEEEQFPQVKIEQREVDETLTDEIIETQEERVESDYELFDPEEEVQFEKDENAEDRLSDMLDEEGEEDEEETPELKERREMESEISKLPTLYLQDTLRSGQTMSYDGNVVVIGDVHPGSEIIAKGDITIWGVLGGIAHAGASGNNFAKIRALKMNAIQLRISGYYARRPDSFNIPYIQRTNEFTPEEARVEDEQIAIYKIYD